MMLKDFLPAVLVMTVAIVFLGMLWNFIPALDGKDEENDNTPRVVAILEANGFRHVIVSPSMDMDTPEAIQDYEMVAEKPSNPGYVYFGYVSCDAEPSYCWIKYMKEQPMLRTPVEK